MKHMRISRRRALQGMGTLVALPVLEAMLPPSVLAGGPAALPRRLAFLYVPNGIHMADWTPRTLGAGFELPVTLQPLAPFRDELLVLSGLTVDKARPHGDGGGDHARAMAAFLTGSQPRKTHGADIRAGVSADQVAAQKVGKATRFASLELGLEGGGNSGDCDSGYSCAYSSNLSWSSATTPMAKETNPRQVFERLFTSTRPGEAGRVKEQLYQRSILDFVSEDARQLRGRLGSSDQHKLDEYLTGVREIEQRLARFDRKVEVPGHGKAALPTGSPRDYREHARLMADMLVLAFQGDLTRISTFVFANDGSNRAYHEAGVPEGHHDMSHHGGKPKKKAQIQKINRFHIEQLAYLLDRLRSIREGERSLLESCMIVYGSGISDGNAHNHDDLPILLLGKGGGSLRPGRHVRFPRETPLTNLYLSLLDRMGVSVPSLGDSTGRLNSLEG